MSGNDKLLKDVEKFYKDLREGRDPTTETYRSVISGSAKSMGDIKESAGKPHQKYHKDSEWYGKGPFERGRPEGTALDDDLHLDRMAELLDSGEAGNSYHAARLVAPDAQGHSRKSTITRLDRKFKKDTARQPIDTPKEVDDTK